jgi:hypothetical protein
MSLRESLKQAVAGAETAKVACLVSIETKHATFSVDDATGSATCMQQQPGNPHETRIHGATINATHAQLPGCGGRNFRPSKVVVAQPVARLVATPVSAPVAPPDCGAVVSGLSAHRIMKQALAAAMRASDYHGDGPAAREQMRREIEALAPHEAAAWRDHFSAAYPPRGKP